MNNLSAPLNFHSVGVLTVSKSVFIRLPRRGSAGRCLCRRIVPAVPRRWRVFQTDPRRIKSDFPQIRGYVSDQIFVEWLARHHRQLFTTYIKNGCNTQIQLTLIANDLLKRFAFERGFGKFAVRLVEEIGKGHRRRILGAPARQQEPRALPGANSSSSPSAVALAQSY